MTLQSALNLISTSYPMLVMLDVQGNNEAANSASLVMSMKLEDMVVTKLKPGVWTKAITSQGTYDPTQLYPYTGDLYFAVTLGPQDQRKAVELWDAINGNTNTPNACINSTDQPTLAQCAANAMARLKSDISGQTITTGQYAGRTSGHFLYVEANQKQDTSTDPMNNFRIYLNAMDIDTGWFNPEPELDETMEDTVNGGTLEYFRQDGSCCWNLQNTVTLGQPNPATTGTWTNIWGYNTSDDREKYQMIQDLQFNSVISDAPLVVRSYYQNLGWVVY